LLLSHLSRKKPIISCINGLPITNTKSKSSSPSTLNAACAGYAQQHFCETHGSLGEALLKSLFINVLNPIIELYFQGIDLQMPRRLAADPLLTSLSVNVRQDLHLYSAPEKRHNGLDSEFMNFTPVPQNLACFSRKYWRRYFQLAAAAVFACYGLFRKAIVWTRRVSWSR